MVGIDKVVVDASVVLSWLLPDEKLTKKANELYEKFVNEEIELMSSSLLFYEVVNGLRSAAIQKRIGKEKVKRAIEKLFRFGFEIINQNNVFDKILKTALKYGLSVYDASYVVLAKDNKAKLATFDKKILKNIGDLLYF